MKYKIIILMLLSLMFLLSACGNVYDFKDLIYAQNLAIGQCERHDMQFVGLKAYDEGYYSIICKTTSPLKYYEYPFRVS